MKTLPAVTLKLIIRGRWPTTMDEAWGSGGLKSEGSTSEMASQGISEGSALHNNPAGTKNRLL